MIEFEFVTGDDPYILCVSPTGNLWVNSRTYTNGNGERRYAYECITDTTNHRIEKSEDGILMVVGAGVSIYNVIDLVKAGCIK